MCMCNVSKLCVYHHILNTRSFESKKQKEGQILHKLTNKHTTQAHAFKHARESWKKKKKFANFLTEHFSSTFCGEFRWNHE
jgi:hypothetical protein